MVDREKVIKALELCTSKIETRTQIPCETCPYHNRKYHGVLGNGCCNLRSLQRDALALLKAQKPRVMTLEEVVSHGDEESMYLEHMDGEMIVRPVVLLTSYLDFDKDCLHFAGGWRCCGSFGMNSYGKTWRCWTSRPDQATREATPWTT